MAGHCPKELKILLGSAQQVYSAVVTPCGGYTPGFPSEKEFYAEKETVKWVMPSTSASPRVRFFVAVELLN